MPAFTLPTVVSRRTRLLLALIWIFFVLYPDPRLLVRSIRHLVHPPIDPAAVSEIAARLPNNPEAIRMAVLTRIVPYAYDWQVNRVPWYFPSTREALRYGRGDCESQALVLASVLRVKGIPCRLVMSFDHLWVQYPGKRLTPLENPALAFAEERHGRFTLHWPARVQLWREVRAQVDIYWTPMPVERKLVLVWGTLLILGASYLVPGARASV